MHFQVIKDEYYDGILKRLRSIIPEFHSVFGEGDGIYPILGEFGTYVIDNIDNIEILEKSVKFINESILKGKNDTEDLIVLQLFQKFYENPLITKRIREFLNNESKSVFDKNLNDFNRSKL